MSARLAKLWVARFYERGTKKPFHTDKVVAPTFSDAQFIASEWGANKFNGRLVKVEIERSKGEVIADY